MRLNEESTTAVHGSGVLVAHAIVIGALAGGMLDWLLAISVLASVPLTFWRLPRLVSSFRAAGSHHSQRFAALGATLGLCMCDLLAAIALVLLILTTWRIGSLRARWAAPAVVDDAVVVESGNADALGNEPDGGGEDLVHHDVAEATVVADDTACGRLCKTQVPPAPRKLSHENERRLVKETLALLCKYRRNQHLQMAGEKGEGDTDTTRREEASARERDARTWSWKSLVKRYLRSSLRDFSWTSRPASTFSGVGSEAVASSRWLVAGGSVGSPFSGRADRSDIRGGKWRGLEAMTAKKIPTVQEPTVVEILFFSLD